ncbi:hypothetical protein [Solidesulfovibrio sp.]
MISGALAAEQSVPAVHAAGCPGQGPGGSGAWPRGGLSLEFGGRRSCEKGRRVVTFVNVFEGVLFLALCVVFYVYVYRRLRSEKKETLNECKTRLRRAYGFDVRDVIRDEILRMHSIDSCECSESRLAGGKRRLDLVRKNIDSIGNYFNKNVLFHVVDNSRHRSVEITIEKEHYYVRVLSYPRTGWLHALRKSKVRDHIYQLNHRAVTLFENKDAYLVIRMLVRSLVKEIGHERLFEKRMLLSVHAEGEGPSSQSPPSAAPDIANP